MPSLFNRVAGKGASSRRGPRKVSALGKKQLRNMAEMLDSFETSGQGWFWATDGSGRITYITDLAAERLGLNYKTAVGQLMADFLVPDSSDFEEDDREREERPLSFTFNTHNSISQLTVKLVDAEKEEWWELSGNPQFDGRGQFLGYRGSAKDVTEERERRREVAKLSQFDPLTGLANRRRVKTIITTTLAKFRNSKRSCSLIKLSLDRFKHINDTLGFQAGDELLKQTAGRLKRLVGSKGELARLVSDEFLIVLPDLDDRGELGEFVQNAIQMVSQPYSVNGVRAIVGASAGVATAPYDGVDTQEILNAVDLAINEAKDSRANYRFFSTELKDAARRRRQIEEDLRDAVVSRELVMHYQPIVEAGTHKLKCLEALMRWEHPERGMISPGVFIPIAEELGLIKEMGDWAIGESCRQAQEWPVELRVAVNVSAIQFMDEDFTKVVERALEESKLKPSRLELEITESVFMGDQGKAQRTFNDLKALGVRLALDDFGTGYSSLSYLRNAPFDKIKIDQSFVRRCTEDDNNNTAIINSIISLAESLKMETVAEGVETKDELKLVEELGAASIQGRLFSLAMSHEELVERIESAELTYEPNGPERHRADRRTEYRRIALIHDDHRYTVVLRNLSKSGALVEGLLDVPVGTDVVLDLGGGQLTVATVRRSGSFSQGVEFETPLISDGADGLCTRHRVSPYQIEAAGRPLSSLPDDPYAALREIQSNGFIQQRPPAFREVEIKGFRAEAA